MEYEQKVGAEDDLIMRSLIRTFRSILNEYPSPYERRMARTILLEFAQSDPALFATERTVPISPLPSYPRTQTLMKRYSKPMEVEAPKELTVPTIEFDAERRLILTETPEVFKQLHLRGGEF